MNRSEDGKPYNDFSPRELLINHLTKLSLPTLANFLDSCGVEIFSLPVYVGTKAQETLRQVGTRAFESDNKWFRHFDFLYIAWTVTRNTSGSVLLANLANSLKSYDSLIEAYGDSTDLQHNAVFSFWAKWFVEGVMHPGKILTLYPPTSVDYEMTKLGIYRHQGKWHALPGNDERSVFVEEEVIREISLLSDTLYNPEADLFHATGSAALNGIAEHKALLSARESERRDNTIKTGEYIRRGKDGRLPVGGVGALENLYSSSLFDIGSSTIRWFDEYPVIFGFQAGEIEKYLSNQYGPVKIKGVVSADGLRLGPYIPLSLVTAVYTHSCYMNSLREWVELNIPGRPIISVEAATLLRTRSGKGSTLYPDYPYRFSEPAINDWQSLLQSPAIVLT